MALIADSEKLIRANKEIGSFEVWSDQYDKLQRVSIGRFSAGKWSCQEHDQRFPGVDAKEIDLSNAENLFKAIYRVVLRHGHLSTARWLAHCEGTSTEEGWQCFKQTAFDRPVSDEVAEQVHADWRNVAHAMMSKMKELEERLEKGDWNSLEFRTLFLKSKPTVAGWGCLTMKFDLSGLPDDDPREQGYKNYVELGYMVVIPQETGHAIITACKSDTSFRLPDIARIHDCLPANSDPRTPYQADKALKQRLSNKIWYLNELGFREALYQSWPIPKRAEVQAWMKQRSEPPSRQPGEGHYDLPLLL